MKKPNLSSLSLGDFLKVNADRTARIENSSTEFVAPLDSHKANRLAKALHPVSQNVVVSEIVEHSPDVKSYILTPDTEAGTTSLAYFSAGQYICVNLSVGKAVLSRPYSLSSSPKMATQGKYRLTVKRSQGGLASNYILDNWMVGSRVTVSAPNGDFTYEPLRDAKHILGIAGGSGVTPFISLAHAIADGDEDASLTLLCGNRTAADILFRDELDEITANSPKVKVVHVLSAEEKEGYEHGFIDIDKIKKYLPKGACSVFVCGPQAMYDSMDKALPELGLRHKFIRKEVFGEYHHPERNADYPANVSDNVNITVIIRGEKNTITASTSDTILSAIEKAGIPAPAHCRSGICGWCRARLVNGTVYVPSSVDGRKLADYAYGYIHPCCTFPTSDIEIEVMPVPAKA